MILFKYCWFKLFLLLPILSYAQTINSFEEYLNTVLSKNSNREELSLQNEENLTQQRQIMSQRFPTISSYLNSYQSQQGPRDVYLGGEIYQQPATSYESHYVGLNFREQLFDYGNSIRKNQKVNRIKLSQEAQYLENSRQLCIKAGNAYLDLASVLTTKDLLCSELSDLQDQLVYFKNLIMSGAKPPADSLRFSIQINNIKSQIYFNNSQRMQSQVDVAYYLKQSLIEVDSVIVPEFPTIMESIENITNPKAQKIKENIKGEELNLSIIQWDKFPDVYLNASYDRGGSNIQKLYVDMNKDWNMSISLSLSIPIFQNHKQNVQETQSKLEILRLKNQLAEEELQFEAEISSLIAEISANAKQVQLLEENVKKQRQVYAYDHERYLLGILSYNEYMETKKTLLSSEQKLVTIRYQQLKNQFKLNVLTGAWDNQILSFIH